MKWIIAHLQLILGVVYELHVTSRLEQLVSRTIGHYEQANLGFFATVESQVFAGLWL